MRLGMKIKMYTLGYCLGIVLTILIIIAIFS
nr:MAG TPA: Stage III sporulation protein [Caudoviricetes sp.]